jgi:hypothetical protein
MLMELLPGESLIELSRRIFSKERKERLVHTVANYQSQLLKRVNLVGSSGSLYNYQASSDNAGGGSSAARIVEVRSTFLFPFWFGPIAEHSTMLGPYRSSLQMWNAVLQVKIAEQDLVLTSDTSNGDDEKTAEDAKAIIRRLATALLNLIPDSHDAIDETALCHWDLDLQNILVNDGCQITGIVDWESVNGLPFWRALSLPPFFFDDRLREEKPDPDKDGNGPKSQGKNDMYFEHLLEYELTQLSKLYKAQMDQRHPEYTKFQKEYASMRDIERAVHSVTNELTVRYIRRWLDELEQGKESSFLKILAEPVCSS